MATTVLHECDRCGTAVRMDSTYASISGWMKAEFTPASDTAISRQPVARLYCSKCTDDVQRPLPRIAKVESL